VRLLPWYAQAPPSGAADQSQSLLFVSLPIAYHLTGLPVSVHRETPKLVGEGVLPLHG
jgi:hypothetical protein